MLETVAGAVLWALANAVYVDMKRKGTRGFRRFLAFWFGTPTTWLTFFIMREGTAPRIEAPPDDEAGLLSEVRRDRARRIVAGTTKELLAEQPRGASERDSPAEEADGHTMGQEGEK